VAKSIERLTDMAVRALRLPGRYTDGAGLVLNIAKGGTKSWLFRYRDRQTSKIRELGLGSLQAVSLKMARDLAAECRAMLARGVDPIDAKRKRQTAARVDKAIQQAKAMTFADCVDRYIAAHESSWRNAKHRQQWQNTLDTYAKDLMPLPVGAITTDIVVKALEEIWITKTETATRVRQRMEAVLDWATVRQFRKGDNPARWRGHLDHLLASPSKVRKVEHQAAMPCDAIPALMVRLRERAGQSARLLELVILTACRVGEAAAAEWSEFDLDAGVWTIPGARMKAGKEHRVALSSAAVAMLEAMPKNRRYVFPGTGKRATHMNPESARKLLQKDMSCEGVTVHGFRSAFRDWAAERTGFPAEVAEMALAHAIDSKVEAAYRRGDLFAKRARLMQAWAGFLATKLAAGTNVSPIKKSAGSLAG
jgi:integrase